MQAPNEYVGYSGTGKFTQSGGTNAVSGNGSLSIAYTSGSSGTYTLSGGSLSAVVESVGIFGTANFTQSGGTNTIPSSTGWALYLGSNVGSNATYSLSGGSLSVPNEFVGYSGTGTFTQSGGTNTAGKLTLAYGSGSSGTYGLSGSGLLLVPTEYVGYSGTGTFTQSGGTNDLTGNSSLSIAYSSGSGGTYSSQRLRPVERSH